MQVFTSLPAQYIPKWNTAPKIPTNYRTILFGCFENMVGITQSPDRPSSTSPSSCSQRRLDLSRHPFTQIRKFGFSLEVPPSWSPTRRLWKGKSRDFKNSRIGKSSETRCELRMNWENPRRSDACMLWYNTHGPPKRNRQPGLNVDPYPWRQFVTDGTTILQAHP